MINPATQTSKTSAGVVRRDGDLRLFDAATGRVYGTVYSGLDVGFALSPVIFGVFMDRGWYGATLLGGALVLLCSVVTALGIGERTVARA